MCIDYLSNHHTQAQYNISKLTDSELLTACYFWAIKYNRFEIGQNYIDIEQNKKDILFYIANTLCVKAYSRGIMTRTQLDILLNL